MHAYMGTCSTSKQTTTANSLEIPGRSIRITFNEKSLKYQLCWDQLFRSITVLLLDLLLWERKLLNQNNSESRRTLAPLLLDYARSDKGHSFPPNFAHVSFELWRSIWILGRNCEGGREKVPSSFPPSWSLRIAQRDHPHMTPAIFLDFLTSPSMSAFSYTELWF